MARTKKSKPGKGKQSTASASRATKQPASKFTTKSSSSTPAQFTSPNASSPLLDKLSGELRNHIWRDVLVSDETITVSKTDPHQPPLLRTCKQIRAEATSIYFNENAFDLPMPGFDSTLGLKWCKIARPHLQNGHMSRIGWERETGTETWDDLKVWLRRTQAGEVPRYSPTFYPQGCDEEAEEFFNILERDLVGVPPEAAVMLLEGIKDDIEAEEGLEFGLFDNPGSDC